jgi:uncharacterized protein (TIGR02145 family)
VTIYVTNDACTGGDVITHNGTNYCPVTSPYAPYRVWLDRNLGATKVCADFNDTACFGDYYQWGRNFDGHQKFNSLTTNVQADNVNSVEHGKFIESNTTYANDWARAADANGSIRMANWSKTDGTYVCPTGFRAPTIKEIRDELLIPGSAQIDQNSTQKSGNDDDPRVNAAKCFLKLPSAGYRNMTSTQVDAQGITGVIRSISPTETGTKWIVYNDANAVESSMADRANGLYVRCIKE